MNTVPPPGGIPLARYIMIGGFLGAGKTTAVARLARKLSDQGRKVGLITNDQGNELADTAMLSSRGFPVEEIAGGCFCCRFQSLMDAAKNLSTQNRPDVFIAEPVGSCTDLVATVTYPLRRIYGDQFTVAPLSVLVDPIRALRILGLATGGNFSEKVRYIYRKQLEEADVLVINKADLVTPEQRDALITALAIQFPQARQFVISARSGEGLDSWFDYITAETQNAETVMPIDYEIYADGEALLGWLNATIALTSGEEFDGNIWLRTFAEETARQLVAQGAEVAHFKMTLDPENEFGDLGLINQVGSDRVAELSQELADPLSHGRLIVNIRAEASPEALRAALEYGMAAAAQAHPAVALHQEHLEHFRPGKPTPTHARLTPSGAPAE